jgi:acyl carrier protein
MAESESDILVQIRRVAADELGRPAIGPDDRLIEDLHLDSMELTVLAVELEDHFRLQLSETDALGVSTVGDLARLLAAMLAARAASPPALAPAETS